MSGCRASLTWITPLPRSVRHASGAQVFAVMDSSWTLTTCHVVMGWMSCWTTWPSRFVVPNIVTRYGNSHNYVTGIYLNADLYVHCHVRSRGAGLRELIKHNCCNAPSTIFTKLYSGGLPQRGILIFKKVWFPGYRKWNESDLAEPYLNKIIIFSKWI